MYRSCSVCGRIHPEDKMCKRVLKKVNLEILMLGLRKEIK